jgi:acyl carrier protein
MPNFVFERVRDISADLFHLPKENVTLESSPKTIASWDSIQQLNLVLALEQEFRLQFESEEMDSMENIGAITDLLEAKLGCK